MMKLNGNMMNGEKIVRTGRKSLILMAKQIALAAALLGTGIFAKIKTDNAWVMVGCLAVALILVGTRLLTLSGDRLTVTDRRLIARTGLVLKKVQECPLDKVDSVNVEKTSLLAVLVGCGTVTVNSCNGCMRFAHVARANAFKQALMQAVDDNRARMAAAQAHIFASINNAA